MPVDDPFRVLRRRMKEANAPLGAHLETFVHIVPSDEENERDHGDNEFVQITFKVNRSQMGVDQEQAAEQADFEKQFSALAEGFTAQVQEDETAAAIRAAQELQNKFKKKEPD